MKLWVRWYVFIVRLPNNINLITKDKLVELEMFSADDLEKIATDLQSQVRGRAS